MYPRNLAIAALLSITNHAYSESSDEFIVQLKDPEYFQGVIKTEKGGVIKAPSLRIQARKIVYTNTKTEQTISAQGDLMMEYQNRIYVGDELEYDLQKKVGYLKNGRTKDGNWFVGGRWLQLQEDGNFVLYGAYLTTAPSVNRPWEIKAKKATVEDGNVLKAKAVTFRVFDFPLLWLPSYSTNLTKFRDTPIRYRLQWDKNLNLRASMRYRFFATETFSAFFRFDWRFHKNLGPGAALEADYLSKDKRTTFQTKNYAAYDKEFYEENSDYRYRFQGIYKTKSKDEYTKFHAQWDRISDKDMVNDFKDPDFEINTQKATYAELSHYRKWPFVEATFRPRINSFMTLAQELPSASFGLRTFEFWKSGLYMENYASGAYLDYTFADKAKGSFPNPSSGRVETINSLYRPFSWRGLTVNPFGGIVGIWYSKSPSRQAAAQFLYKYGGNANYRLSRVYPSFKHTLLPYGEFLGYSRPHVAVDDYYVFGINDGYDKLNQLRFGLKQYFFTKENSIFLPGVIVDLYAYSFWGAASFNERIPKAFFDLEVNRQSTALKGSLGWNFQENLLDYGNAEYLWTVNANLALGVELRHRSKYWWRKAIHDNFIVDIARPLNQLLASPLSDRRNTFLTKTHIRFSPRWNMQLQTFYGWDRKEEPNYLGAKVDFYTMVTGSWQVRLSYEFSQGNPYRFTYTFKLIK